MSTINTIRNSETTNSLRDSLSFKNKNSITVVEFTKLFKDLMNVDWVVGTKTYNLIELGWTLGWNNRKTSLGVCKLRSKKIEISKFLLKLNLDKPSEWEDTIRHEIAHAIEVEMRGVSSHGRIWKRICGYTLANPTRTCDNPLDVGNGHKFELVCPNCEASTKYFRKPKVNKACGECCNTHNFGRFSEDYRLVLKTI